METLEKIPYVISVYFPVLFFLLAGLGLAWWLWYKHASRLNQVLSQNERLNKELSGLLRANPSAGSKGKSQGAAKSTTASDKVKAPSKEASKPQGNKAEKAKTEAAAPAPEKKSDAATKTTSAYKPSEKVMASYKGEDIKVDDDLGVLFNSRPKEVDDLKKVNGVGKVLEGKLQEIGIYRFRQIANWDKSLMAEFSNRLAFPGRVERDEWKKQAIALHKEKYGESL